MPFIHHPAKYTPVTASSQNFQCDETFNKQARYVSLFSLISFGSVGRQSRGYSAILFAAVAYLKDGDGFSDVLNIS